MGPKPPGVTGMLRAWQAGDQNAGESLIVLLYDELRRLAAHYMRDEQPGHTLQPTALVHELYLRMFAAAPLDVSDRGHFMALAARQLRHLLVDHARHRRADKRGGIRVDLRFAMVKAQDSGSSDIETLDQALTRLEGIDSRSAQVVELRYFGGLTEKEVAGVLGVSLPTVKRDWEFARSWLLSQMS